jgi:eukaryotic-like serine/threonine-protein kinase
MLKDKFNNDNPKKKPPTAPLSPKPIVGPQQTMKKTVFPSQETPDNGASELASSKELASMALSRLIENYQPEELKAAQPVEPEEPQPNKSPISFEPQFPDIERCELSGAVFHDLYQVHGKLAKGGMGQVMLCTHLRREIPVVMKLMLREADPQDIMFQRFVRECTLTGRLTHPNLVRVMDFGISVDTKKPYLVMEFVEGQSLRQILRAFRTLAPAYIAHILVQTCEGLVEVHGKGIIHRDLKPENLMVRGVADSKDNVKILDFGIAQLQQDKRFDESGWAVGSIGYMSPEQVRGLPVDLRTDIYSLGLILYEALTGTPPFRGQNPRETMVMHVKAPVMPPSQLVNWENAELLDRICLRALAKSPDDRYQDASEMQNDIALLLE